MEAPVERFLLSQYPAGTILLATRSYRPGYRDYPMQVALRTPEGPAQCVIKMGDQLEPIAREARVLAALAELGLPVPVVLAGPVPLAQNPDIRVAMVLSELPGHSLPWLGLRQVSGLEPG